MRNEQFILVAAIAVLVAFSPNASAQQFWDGSVTVGDGVVHGGTGTWIDDGITTNWTNSVGTVNNAYNENTDMVFSGATGTVTLGSDIIINGNSVLFSTDGYVITSKRGAIVLETTPTITVNAGLVATIDATIEPFTPNTVGIAALPAKPPADAEPGLTKTGAGTLVLGGLNTYTGVTTINAGVLSISQDANLGTPPVAPVIDQLTFNGGTLQAAASFTLNANRGVTLNVGGGTIDVTGANVLRYDGVISGTGSLTKIGTGTLALGGINAYSGFTAVNAGFLQARSTGAFSAASAFTVNAGAVLDLNGFDNTVGSLSGSGLVTNSGGFGDVANNATLTLGANNTSTTFSGTLQDGVDPGSTLTLTKVGTGTLTLTGTNTYTGITTLNAGVLSISRDANLGLPPGTSVADQLTFNGGTLQATASFTLGPNRGVRLNLFEGVNGGTFDVTKGNVLTVAGVITGPGSLTEIGTGTLILAGVNTYTGITTLNGGVLTISQDANLGTAPGTPLPNQLTFNFGTLEATASFTLNRNRGITLVGTNNTISVTGANVLTYGGVIAGSGSFLKGDTGTLILSGVNTYTGITTINAGVLNISQDANLGATPAAPVADQLLFNGGTLQATATFNLSPNRGVTLNAGGTFDVTAANVLTYGGVIAGPGSLTKAGTGKLTLLGINTYRGGTIIDAGTLQLGAGGTTGSILGNVNNRGVLAFDRSNALIFDGVITGGGSVEQNGTGTTVLVENNAYTGGTIINAGTLQLGTGGTTGSITGNVNDKGILAFNRSDVLIFGGVISGGGSVQQNGTGTTVLVGNNTYTGGTTIHAGTLQIGDGGMVGSIAGNVVDNGTLAFDRRDSVIFAGTIGGGGNVVKLGAGTLTFPAAEAYTGATTVNSGSLIVDGSIASAQTVVNPGGFLGGHGTIGGNLVNSGTVGQTHSPETLTVGGNYTQSASGTLRIGVGGVAPAQHDLLVVNGHATLGGTLQLFPLGGFTLQPGEQITFLTAKNGISGTFSNTQNGLLSTGTIVETQVTALANAVVLETTVGLFENIPGLSHNESAVAKALDSARGDPREAALFAFLDSQPLAKLPHDLDLIAPAQITSINATAVSVGKVQVSNVGQRLANIRGGSTGFSSAGFSLTGGATGFGQGFAGVSGPEGKSGPAVFTPTPENRWGVFVTGLGEFSNVDSTPNAAGYDVSTGGFTFGVDYRLTPNFAIGLTGGYAHTTVGLDGGGNIDVNGGKLGLYATVFANGFYLDTAVSGGPSGYTTRRTALQGTASGSTDGADVNALIAVGYDWTRGNLSIGPTASFQYSYIGLNSFTETGSLAPLKFPDQNTESERSAFGAKVSYQWKIAKVTAIPQVSAAWQHEYGDTAYSIASSFASGAGKGFTVTGPDIGRDSLLVGAGVTVILNERVSTYLFYDGEFARTNYLSNNVSGGVRVNF